MSVTIFLKNTMNTVSKSNSMWLTHLSSSMALWIKAISSLKGLKASCWILTKVLSVVTSSNPVAGRVTIGSGVGRARLTKVVGVCKAYTSQDGDGPFPTEAFDEVGERIRRSGSWAGTTTGRPRRVGWFDSVVMRHGRRVSGIHQPFSNSIDVLSGLDTVKICVAYDLGGESEPLHPKQVWASSNTLQAHLWRIARLVRKNITGVRSLKTYQKRNATNYVRRVQRTSWNPHFDLLSRGPGREQTNILESVWSSL